MVRDVWPLGMRLVVSRSFLRGEGVVVGEDRAAPKGAAFKTARTSRRQIRRNKPTIAAAAPPAR